MAFDFPSSPTNGQQFTPAGGPTYTWNTATGAWLLPTATAGYVNKAGDTMTGPLVNAAPGSTTVPQLDVDPPSGLAFARVKSVDSGAIINIDKNGAGQNAYIAGLNNNVLRWVAYLGYSAPAETGSNSGSDFTLRSFSDTGVALDFVLTGQRATGLLTVKGDPTAALGIATKQYVDNAAVGTMIERIYTSTATWTKPAGLKYITIDAVGAGGAGAGTAATGAGAYCAGGGGGGGSLGTKLYDAASVSTMTITIPAGGVSVSGGNGGSGGTLTIGGLLSITGGLGGTRTSAVTSATLVAGAAGGTTGSGWANANARGSSGSYGVAAMVLAQNLSKGGDGGTSPYGMAAMGYIGISSGTAGSAVGYGAGGAGAFAAPNLAAQIGGDGSAGLVIIREFY